MGKFLSKRRNRPVPSPARGELDKVQKDFQAFVLLPDKTGFSFDDWIEENELNEATRAKLVEEDLTTRRALAALTPEEIVSLKLTVGQRKILEDAIKEIENARSPSQRVPATSHSKDGGPRYTGMPRSAARPPRDDSSKTSAAEESEYVEPGVKEKKKGGRNTAMPRSAARPPRDDSSKASAAEESEYVEPGEEEKKKETGKRMLRALYDFKSAEKLDLNFSKGDLMELVTDMGNWWLAKKQDGTEGYVPSNYVALENTMESMDWFFGELSRPEAQQFLRADTADIGSFLIRKSQREQGLLVLSVRGPPRQDNAKPVDHYKIVGNESEGYHITPKITFSTVDQLVDHYKDCTDGMYCALTSPCPRPKPVQQDLSKETEDVWEIDRSTLTFSDKPIGSGQFGEVWKGMWKGTTEVAIKTMKEDSMDADKFLAEAAIMKKFRHPHLVKLYAVCSKQEPVLIVTEFMRNGSLLDYLRRGDGRNCSLSDLMHIAAQVAGGMAYLEENNFIHRDLAARNILVGELNVVKVADFGLARPIEGDEYNVTKDTKLPVRWTAPEVMFKHRCTIKSDVWSFGVLLHEIMTKGQRPYVGMSNADVKKAVRNGYHMDRDKDVPEQVYELMVQCWDMEDEKRPDFATLQRFFFECRIDGSHIVDGRDDFDDDDDDPYNN